MPTSKFSPDKHSCDRCLPRLRRPAFVAIASVDFLGWLCPFHAVEWTVTKGGWGYVTKAEIDRWFEEGSRQSLGNMKRVLESDPVTGLFPDEDDDSSTGDGLDVQKVGT